MALELKSPKENAAKDEVVFIQKITTDIKEIIVSDVNLGVPKEITTQKIAKLIGELDDVIKFPQLLRESKQALALSVQRWYYEYSYNLKTIRTATISNINYAITRYKGDGLAVKNKGITINPQLILEEMQGTKSNAEFIKVYEKFRPYVDDATKGLAVIQDYQKLVNGQVKVLAADPPISNRVDIDGKPYKVNLRNRSEMYVRYQANQEDLQRFIQQGIDLVWISSHADASPRCRTYQGKLYSISGESGSINGISYSPLSEALLGPKGDGNGCISGYNCRHRLIEYETVSKAPNDYTEAEMKKAYEVDQKQRQFENQIRLLKTEERLFRASGSTKRANVLKLRWQLINNQYEQYSLKNGRAFYRWRTSIGDEEVNQRGKQLNDIS